jgi:hypothetical protein
VFAVALLGSLVGSLSGCVGPLIAGAEVVAGAVTHSNMNNVPGFAVYKTVATPSGGSVVIQFPSKDGKAEPPPALPAAQRVAIWPGDEAEVTFANRLSASGKYKVIPPATVSALLQKNGIDSDLRKLTDDEQQAAFETICRDKKAEQVLASHSLGETQNKSVRYAYTTAVFKADLLAFSCRDHAITWRDQIALTTETSGNHIASAQEINQAGADAWADRIMQAEGYPLPETTAAAASGS